MARIILLKLTSTLFFISLLSSSLVKSTNDELVFLANKDFEALYSLKGSLYITNNPSNKLEIKVFADKFEKFSGYYGKDTFDIDDLESFLNKRVANREKIEELVISFNNLYNTIDRNTFKFTRKIPEIIALFDNIKNVYVKNSHISENSMTYFHKSVIDSFLSLFSNKNKSYKITFCNPRITDSYLKEFNQLKIKGIEMSIEKNCRDD